MILDIDLAAIYGVTTKRLNEQVKRNLDRFPSDFAFQVTPAEKSEVVANCDHLRRLKFSPVLPRAFTEHGAIMAANVLNSPRAVQMSVFVARSAGTYGISPCLNAARCIETGCWRMSIMNPLESCRSKSSPGGYYAQFHLRQTRGVGGDERVDQIQPAQKSLDHFLPLLGSK